MVTVLLHELTHAVTATLLGQTVLRVIVGEGPALVRFGRQPQIVIGRVVVGNGATWVLDLQRAGYRWRTSVMLLAAPLVSLLVAAAAWYASGGWGIAGRSAALTFGGCNLAMAVITLLPLPTFGGRVWSDLASALFLLRATETEIAEQMVGAVRTAMAVHIERGDFDGAIAVARAGVGVAPDSPLAHSLLAFALPHCWQACRGRGRGPRGPCPGDERSRSRLPLAVPGGCRGYRFGRSPGLKSRLDMISRSRLPHDVGSRLHTLSGHNVSHRTAGEGRTTYLRVSGRRRSDGPSYTWSVGSICRIGELRSRSSWACAMRPGTREMMNSALPNS